MMRILNQCRVNIANANVFGLSTELDLNVNNRYNTALVIFFVPYVLFEIPSNLLLKHCRPRYWLSACMFLFGLTTVCQGFVRNYSGLLAARFFLGFFETGMFPGCEYLTFEHMQCSQLRGRLLLDRHVVPKT
jgi:MFS family permease